MNIFNELYFRKSQKLMRKCVNNINSSVLDHHFSKEEINYINDTERTINKWTNDLSGKYENYKNTLSHNYEQYYRKNRMFPRFIIVKLWTYMKAYTWIIYWYLTA